MLPARRPSEHTCLGPPQEGVNCNFSSPEFDKPYGVRKLSISDALICSLSRIGQKIKKWQLFHYLAENLEKFRSPEHYGAPLEGSTIFLCLSYTCGMSMESCWLAELKYAFFRTGHKTKKLPRSKLFLCTVLKHGLLEGSTILLQ